VIVVICAIGAYTVHNAMLVWFDKAEDSFRQAMLVSQGDLAIMWAHPLVGSVTTLALALLFWPLISKVLALLRPAKRAEFVERPLD